MVTFAFDFRGVLLTKLRENPYYLMQIMLPKGKVRDFCLFLKFSKYMTVLGIITLVFGVAGVLLTIKQSIWCWPSALISVVTSGFEFYESRLYGDMALQGFYFIAGVYGWIYWEKHKNKTFEVTTIPATMATFLIGSTVLQAIVYYFLLSYFKGDQVVFDAILTACSITATYMMTKKWMENWICWVLIDFAYIALYGIKELWLYAVLYFVFTLMAAYGFYKWKTQKS